MRITCTGPNGEKFEAETDNAMPEKFSHNIDERTAVQKALETWCRAFGVDKDTAVRS